MHFANQLFQSEHRRSIRLEGCHGSIWNITFVLSFLLVLSLLRAFFVVLGELVNIERGELLGRRFSQSRRNAFSFEIAIRKESIKRHNFEHIRGKTNDRVKVFFEEGMASFDVGSQSEKKV